MTTFTCRRCETSFDSWDVLRTHRETCDDVPDCQRCEASFDDRDARIQHVHFGGCDVEVDVPEQPWQDQIHALGAYQGHSWRFV